MVIFNPQLPQTPAREYTNVSRPISDIPADKSTALAISTATEALESGVKIAETAQQDVIKEKTRAGVEALQSATTAAYENVRSAQIKGQQPDPQAANVAGLTLLQKAGNNVPEALQSGLDRAEDLALARSQGTLKANDTLYTGALNSLAKQLRAEYPGHKDFIDEQISRISGKNPANAYMDNLLTDISRLATGTDSIEKKIVSQAFQNQNFGDPAVFKALKAYQAKLPGSLDNLANAVNAAEKERLEHQKTMSTFQEQEAAGKINTGQARYQAQQSAQSTVFRNFNGLLATAGLTPKIIDQLVNESRTGKITSMTPPQWESLAQHLEADRDNVANQIKSNFNQFGISSKLASGNDIEAENKIINNELQFYDRAIAAIRDPQKGTFLEMQRRAKGIQDAVNYQAMSGPIGDFLAKSAIIQEKVGPNWTNLVDRMGLTKGYLGPMQDFLNNKTQAAGAPEDPRIGNVGKSLTSDIIAAKRAAAQGTKFDPRLYQDLVQNVDLITKATEMGQPEVAREIVKYMFDPTRNSDFVKQWSRDFKDRNGVQHNGYFAYYDYMTQPKIADSIRKLGDTGTWNMYRNWQETNFRQLFGNEVQELNKIGESNYFPSTMHWNSDTNQMQVVFSRKAKDLSEQTRMDSFQESIANLNKGLRNLAYTYKTENTEPNEGLFTMLQQLGYNPNGRLVGENLPAQVVKAIAASQFTPSQEERMKSSFDRLQK